MRKVKRAVRVVEDWTGVERRMAKHIEYKARMENELTRPAEAEPGLRIRAQSYRQPRFKQLLTPPSKDKMMWRSKVCEGFD